MKKLLVIVFLSFSSPLAFSQGTFPLHIGDTWKYWWMNTSGFVTQPIVTKVHAIISVGGLSYFTLPQERWPFTYLRHSGDTVKTFTLDSTGEITVFHRWMNVGDSLAWGWPGVLEPNWAVVTSIDTGQAIFGDSLTLHTRWTITIVTSEHPQSSTLFWVIEDSIGIVEWSEGWLTGTLGGLIAAQIDGHIYGPMTSVPLTEESIPISSVILAAYPNPFNSQTTISLTTSKAGELRVTLHDLVGRELQLLRTESVTPGTTVFSVSLSNYSSGVYLLRASVDEQSVAKRLILLK